MISVQVVYRRCPWFVNPHRHVLAAVVVVLCDLEGDFGTGVGLGEPRFDVPDQVSRAALEVVGMLHQAGEGGREIGGIRLPVDPRAVAVLVLHVVGYDAGGSVGTAPGDGKVGGLAGESPINSLMSRGPVPVR